MAKADRFPKVEVHLNDRLELAAIDVYRHASAGADRITPYQFKALGRLATPGAHIGITAVYGVRGGWVTAPEVFLNEPGTPGVAKLRGDSFEGLRLAGCVALSGWDHWVTQFEISDHGHLVLKRATVAIERRKKQVVNG